MRCGTPGAVKGYDKPGSCARLGRVVLGAGAFVLARRLPDGAMGNNVRTPPGPWVEAGITGKAKAAMDHELSDAYAKPNTAQLGYDFVFNGRPLLANIGGDGISVFLLAPNVHTARQIVASVCRKGCNKPFPGPTG